MEMIIQQYQLDGVHQKQLKKKKFSEKSDIHSLAIVFFEIISNGQIPFIDMTNTEVIIFVCEGGYPKKPSATEEDIYELSKSIINLDPLKRPSLDEITTKLEKLGYESPDVDTVFTNYYKVQKEQYEKVPSEVDVTKIKEKKIETPHEYEVGPSQSEMVTVKVYEQKENPDYVKNKGTNDYQIAPSEMVNDLTEKKKKKKRKKSKKTTTDDEVE